MTQSQNPGQPGNPESSGLPSNPPSNPGQQAPSAYEPTVYGQPQPDQATTVYGQPDQPTSAFGPAQTQQPGQPQQQWGPAPGGQYPQGAPYPQQGFAPVPAAAPSFLSRLPLPAKLGALSGIFGVITFFMGFVAWISIDESIERDAERWAEDNFSGSSIDIPAFMSPSLITGPAWFFILLGAVGIAAFGLIATKWRKFLPYLAFLAVGGWLGLLAAAFGLPAFIGMGAGAIVALIFGFIQAALLGAATLLDGLAEDRQN